MEPLEVLAGTTLALILTEASKESGKSLGKSASELISQLRKALWNRIIQKNKLPDISEPEVLEGEILEVFQEDPNIAEQASLVIRTVEEADEVAEQVIIEHASARNITLQGIRQVAESYKPFTRQVIASDVEVFGDINISDVTQQG